MDSILSIKDNYSDDESIKSLETYAYQPISGTQLNGAGQITIRIENQDSSILDGVGYRLRENS